MRYQIGLYESPRGSQVADHSDYITALQWSTDTGGDKDLTYTATIAPRDAMALFDRRDILHVQVSRGMEVLWQGRVTAAGISIDSTTSVRIQALGYRVAMYDTLYTALWRTESVAEWQPRITRTGERMDLYNSSKTDFELIVSMQARQYTTVMRGRWAYEVPSGSSRPITTIRMTLQYEVPNNVTLEVLYGPTLATATTAAATIVGPATSTTAVSTSVAASLNTRAILVGLRPTASLTLTTADDFFVEVHDIVIGTRTASTDTQANGNYSEVVGDLIAEVNDLQASYTNALDIVSSTAQVQTMESNWATVAYEDLRPGDILDELCAIGNGTTLMEWGVDEQRVLYVRPVTDIQSTWQIEVDSLTMDRMNTTLFNSVYTIRTTPAGTKVRDNYADDVDSIDQVGLVRETVVDASLFAAQSLGINSFANSRLNYLSTPLPEVRFTPSRVVLLGAIVQPYRVRAGDAIEIINALFIGVDGLSRKRKFRVIETRYDAIADSIEVVPEKAPPRLEDVVGR